MPFFYAITFTEFLLAKLESIIASDIFVITDKLISN
jgi:hypothetical protein